MGDRRDNPGRRGRARRRSFWHPAGLSPIPATAALLVCALTACNEPANGTLANAPDLGRGFVIERLPSEALKLEGAAGSLDELLRTVERGLAESDTVRLYDLMISEREYRDILFPAFPVSHPPIDAPFETVWILQYSDSYRGLRRLLERYSGRDVRVTAIRFDEPDQDFVNFILHETSRVDVTVDGEPVRNVRLFGSVIQIGGQWKVLTYPDDPDDPA
jgi:hypothetical protein